jgi:ketol-acid reductoisomerase
VRDLGDRCLRAEAERDAGYPNLQRLRAEKLSPEVVAFEEDLRARLGQRARGTSP